MATQASIDLAQQLYVAYYGRPADPAGQTFWADAFDAAGDDLTDALANFGAGDEYTALSAGKTDTQLIESLYQQQFGHAADAEGLAFYLDRLDSGAATLASIAKQIADGATGDDATALANKVSVANIFTTNVENTGADFGTDDIAAAQAVLTAVDATKASVTAGNAAAVSAVNAILNPVVGSDVALSALTDTLVGTSADDTFTGTSASFTAVDTILDQSGDDNDTLNVTLTATGPVGASVNGIENINVDWNAFGTAGFDTSATSGATVTFTSSKVGYLGSTTVTGAGSNTFIAGDGADGTFTVGGGKAVTVDAGTAKAVVVNSTGTSTKVDVSATVTAGASTKNVTVGTTNAFVTTSIDAGKATTIAIADAGLAAGASTSLTVGGSATVTNTGTGTLSLNVGAAGLTTTLSAIGKSLDIAGDNATTLKATAAALTTETVTDSLTSGDLTVAINGALAANADLSKVAADLFTITGAGGLGGFELAVASGSSISTAVDLAAAGEIGVLLASDSAADTLTLTSTAATQTLIDVDASATTGDIETLNLVANAKAVVGTDSTFTQINAGANKVVLTGTNDVVVTNVVAKTLDASALVGTLSVTSTTVAAALEIMGATGKNTAVFGNTTSDAAFTGQNSNDNVTFVGTSGNSTAILGNGTNTVTSASGTTGSLVVIGGDGTDTVTATTAGDGTGEINLNLGGGVDIATITTTAAAQDTVTIDSGEGGDVITLLGVTDANDIVTITAGEGTDTLNISTDLTDGTITLSGVDTIAIGANTATAVVDAALLNAQAYAITGQGTVTDVLQVQIDIAGSYDFSGLAIDQTLTKGLGGLQITDNTATATTIVGTSFADAITGGAGVNTITGGKGADVLTDAGTTTFVFAAGDSGKTTGTNDEIVGFDSGSDKISIGVAGSAINFAAVDATTGAGDELANATTAVAAAAATLNGTVVLAYMYDSVGGVDSWLVYDSNGDGNGDMAIQITGLGVGGVAATDVIA